jgi:hypothetical protein
MRWVRDGKVVVKSGASQRLIRQDSNMVQAREVHHHSGTTWHNIEHPSRRPQTCLYIPPSSLPLSHLDSPSVSPPPSVIAAQQRRVSKPRSPRDSFNPTHTHFTQIKKHHLDKTAILADDMDSKMDVDVPKEVQPHGLTPTTDPGSIPTLDGWIENLMNCKQLAENDVQRLCDRVRIPLSSPDNHYSS